TTLSTTSDAQINGITVGTGNNNVFANTAIGFSALSQCQSAGQQNTAIGRSAMMMNTTGRENTATGKESLRSNTVGKYNTAFGNQSLFSTRDGDNNTAVGYMALRDNTTGDNNTALGKYAGRTGDFNNTTTIGANAVRTADNQVRIGNISVTSIGGVRGWSTLSDARFKKNIEEKVIGLDFIMALRPVTYNIDIKSIENFRETPSQLRSEESERKAEEILQTGFIAQEVELAANKLGYDFSGVDAPQNDKDNYGLRYSEFVVPLVKAMQEQQELILKLQERISVLEKK
ncbi:MAG: tail fiber domain-containing protein, partial [Vicingaceae bacterium]